MYFSTVALSDLPIKGIRSRTNTVRGPVSSMALTPVDEAEVARVMRSLKSKKSCDINGMSVWLLKNCFTHILTPLTKLINLSFEKGIFPSYLKTAKTIPIFKKGDPCNTNNYRPISILPVFSKIYEKLFLNRLLDFLESFEIISPQQFGFRKGRSTIDAITNLLDDIVDGLERREHVMSIFLDLSKAFDCVHHETLLHQLEVCGVRGLPHKWISSYIKDRGQCVQIADALSERVNLSNGVPQGSILGPILFILYVNNMNSSIQNGKMVQYADDTTLCIKSKSLEDLEINTFIDLNSCIQRFAELNLRTNSSKSKAIKFSLRNQDHETKPGTMVDDIVIDDIESTKFLGMHLDRGLTWDDHIESICSKVTSGIFVLRHLVKFCSPEVLKMAYFGLIHPHLAYGIILWGSCAKIKLERVFRLQKKAIRIISKLNSRESCRDAFTELGMLTLPCLYMFEVAVYCRSKCALVRGRDVHLYETRGRESYRAVQHRTVAYERLPSQVGVRLINKLPGEIKQCTNINQFKARLKRLLVSKAFYSVDEFMMCRWDA